MVIETVFVSDCKSAREILAKLEYALSLSLQGEHQCEVAITDRQARYSLLSALLLVQEEALRFYHADGSYHMADSPEEVVACRIEASNQIVELEKRVVRGAALCTKLNADLEEVVKERDRLKGRIRDLEDAFALMVADRDRLKKALDATNYSLLLRGLDELRSENATQAITIERQLKLLKDQGVEINRLADCVNLERRVAESTKLDLTKKLSDATGRADSADRRVCDQTFRIADLEKRIAAMPAGTSADFEHISRKLAKERDLVGRLQSRLYAIQASASTPV